MVDPINSINPIVRGSRMGNRTPKDITTNEDEGSVEEAREAWLDMRAGMR